MKKLGKPQKKSDVQLLKRVDESVSAGSYIFLNHAKQRLRDRDISDITVLDILEGKLGRKRKRNKAKDHYIEGNIDWKYCIEGIDYDGDKIRIIISFDELNLLVITVIRLCNKRGAK